MAQQEFTEHRASTSELVFNKETDHMRGFVFQRMQSLTVRMYLKKARTQPTEDFKQLSLASVFWLVVSFRSVSSAQQALRVSG